MAKENFLRIPDLDGKINDPQYKKWIPVYAVTFGQGQNGNGGLSTGTARVKITDLTFVKTTDDASPSLVAWNSSGKQLAEAAIFLSSLGPGSALAIFLMKKVHVNSVQWGGSTGEAAPTESVTLSFEESQYMPVVQYLARRAAAAVAGLLH